MKKILAAGLLFLCGIVSAQTDTANQVLRAFPITGYILDLEDSAKLVQIEMPDHCKLSSNQAGLLWGVYSNSKADAVQKGYAKCRLIKGDYYYFSVTHNNSGLPLVQGDLLYTFMKKTDIYEGQLPQLAAHFIRLLDVYETPFYDRYTIFLQWSRADEKKIIDSMVADIRFTGQYFLKENPSMDKPILSGAYQGKKTLYVMAECQPADLLTFFDYIIARPRLYAGKEWKVSEIFATWLSEGAPSVLRK